MSTPTDPASPDPTPDAPTRPARSRVRRWVTWGAIALVTIVVVGYGLILLYAKVLRDTPDELGADDLAAALSDDSIPGTGDGSDEDEGAGLPAADGARDGSDEATAAAEVTVAPDGTGQWTATEASQLGYRVEEILFGVNAEAVGRTNQITGAMTIDGTTVTDAEFTVDVASITSDDGRRDNQFRGRIMSTDEFPEAVFTLTEPIELGAEPGDGVSLQATATGELTLRGVTNPVSFEVTAEQADGRIGVLGSIPIEFADYDIGNPSVPGITTEDHGLVEFVLVFEPA